ncbi:MAG: 4-hydroxybenzoate octaprenyltransferase [Paracoccaceae bacterium]|nr:4-hydroxybenzoate octaprenyltransferase [Paracoccaceae bacterium]
MSQSADRPEPEGKVADATAGNWVDKRAPRLSRAFLRLSRADRPIGTWLLLLPCWWGLTLAMLADGQSRWQDLWIFIGCGLGAWLMRGAGCTWNDITDRKIDAEVERTQSRPLPSGQTTVKAAVIWMIVQTALAFAILLTFNLHAIMLGVFALLPATIYPFAKRFTWWPQIFLGLAFNWGALLAWTAHSGSLAPAAALLYAAGISWTLFYDTIYAHQDIEDDALIGVKSTARLFRQQTPVWLIFFMTLTVILMGLASLVGIPTYQPRARAIGMVGALSMGLHMLWQLRQLELENKEILLFLFRSNRNAGFFPVIFFALALLT